MTKYQNFKDWAISSGFEEGLEIDRINNKKGYYPSNCRFVDKMTNIINRTNTIMVKYNGSPISLIELSNTLGFTIRQRNTVRERINNGWDSDKAISTPIIPKNVPKHLQQQ